MRTAKRKQNSDKPKREREDDAIRSNELLAAIREQMVRRRSGPKEHRPKELRIEEPD